MELVITLSDYFWSGRLRNLLWRRHSFHCYKQSSKKSKKNDDLDLYDFEIETAPQKRSLCVDSIRMLYSGEIDEFVEKELLPDAAETMNALSEAEKQQLACY